MAARPSIEPFVVKDCALAAIATGRRAQNLRELRDHLQAVHPGSIYYHFWGGLLRPHFDDPEYNNDFASWVRHALHDTRLAEYLGIIDPAEFGTSKRHARNCWTASSSAWTKPSFSPGPGAISSFVSCAPKRWVARPTPGRPRFAVAPFWPRRVPRREAAANNKAAAS